MTESLDKLRAAAQRAKKQGMASSMFVPQETLGNLGSISREYGLAASHFGGYADAERQVCCFYESGEEPCYPIACIALHARTPLEHRQILGSVLSLGLVRDVLGDILIEENNAYLFCMENMAAHIAASLLHVGKNPVECRILDALPELSAPEGSLQRITLASPRLDAILAGALHLSRGDAALLLSQRRVSVNHSLTEKADKKISEGDTLSIRGWGRLRIQEIGAPTKKGRIPIIAERFIKSKNTR